MDTKVTKVFKVKTLLDVAGLLPVDREQLEKVL
jgi:hypothetical protein